MLRLEPHSKLKGVLSRLQGPPSWGRLSLLDTHITFLEPVLVQAFRASEESEVGRSSEAEGVIIMETWTLSRIVFVMKILKQAA